MTPDTPSPDPRRLRVVSNGTRGGTKVYLGDALVEGVVALQFNISVNEPLGVLDLRVRPAAIELLADAGATRVEPSSMDDASETVMGPVTLSAANPDALLADIARHLERLRGQPSPIRLAMRVVADGGA